MIQKSRYLIRLVDDEPDFLDAAEFLLQTEGWRTVSYTESESFLRELTDEPGVIILDVRMPKLSGPELQEELNARRCRLPIVFLTGHGDLDVAVHVFRAGACDFLQKPVKKEALIEALLRAVKKDDERRADPDSPLSRYAQLTDREKDIVADVAQSLSNKMIAEHFGISERTVEAHRASAMKKLGIRKPKEAADLLAALKSSGQIF